MKVNKVKNALRETAVSTDLFTVLCRSNLGVECVKEYRFHDKRKWRFDYAIPEHKSLLKWRAEYGQADGTRLRKASSGIWKSITPPR